MAEKHPRAYSYKSREAVALLGRLIHLQRKRRNMTAQDLADRTGTTRTTLRRIESGDLACKIGLVFEVAAVVGVPLFDETAPEALTQRRESVEEKIALLPQSVRHKSGAVDDDF